MDNEIPQADFASGGCSAGSELIREICSARDEEIIKGHVSRDHVHIFVSVQPHLSVSQLFKSIKGKTSRKLLMEK